MKKKVRSKKRRIWSYGELCPLCKGSIAPGDYLQEARTALHNAFKEHDWTSPSSHMDIPHFEIVCGQCDEYLEVELILDIGVSEAV